MNVNVSKFMVRQSRKFLRENGILTIPEQKMENHCLRKNTITLVQEFYCDDEYSHQMAGEKYFISVSRNNHIRRDCYYVI